MGGVGAWATESTCELIRAEVAIAKRESSYLCSGERTERRKQRFAGSLQAGRLRREKSAEQLGPRGTRCCGKKGAQERPRSGRCAPQSGYRGHPCNSYACSGFADTNRTSRDGTAQIG